MIEKTAKRAIETAYPTPPRAPKADNAHPLRTSHAENNVQRLAGVIDSE